MIMNVKITCFPTLTQRRELCALSHNAAQFREELFDAMIHHPQKIEDAPLPEAYQSLPTAMLQQVWKQAQRMKAGSKRDQYRIRRTLPSCQWKRTEMEVRENQLVLDAITQPVYYIAPVAQRHLMKQGEVVKITLKEAEDQWAAVLCLLIDERKKGLSEVEKPMKGKV